MKGASAQSTGVFAVGPFFGTAGSFSGLVSSWLSCAAAGDCVAEGPVDLRLAATEVKRRNPCTVTDWDVIGESG